MRGPGLGTGMHADVSVESRDASYGVLIDHFNDLLTLYAISLTNCFPVTYHPKVGMKILGIPVKYSVPID